jgi:tRNA A-37 threonylcarbamoyl transferase component Bud32
VSMPSQVGRYKILGELGRGAMGVVYRGVDPALDRPVAIKLIAARTAHVPVAAEELEARFMREARVSARINHPGVVMVHDAGREGESLYLVMELIDGESLAARIHRAGFPSPTEALEIVAQTAEALAAAHAIGVIHRDVKPGNIMITKDGRVKVADFGVAKAIGEETNLTRTGTVVGSPAYMAPEQVRGEELDGRSDLFSLGVVLYELLLHRKPFPSDTVTTLIYQILHSDPLADPEISKNLGPGIADMLRCVLAKTPDGRFHDGKAMAMAARSLVAQLGGRVDVGATAPTAMLRTPPVGLGGVPQVEASRVGRTAAGATRTGTARAGAQPATPTTKTPVTPTIAAPMPPPPARPAERPPSSSSLGRILGVLGVGLLLFVAALALPKLLRRAPAAAIEPTPTQAPAPEVGATEPVPTAALVAAVATPIPTPFPIATAVVMEYATPVPTFTPAPAPTQAYWFQPAPTATPTSAPAVIAPSFPPVTAPPLVPTPVVPTPAPITPAVVATFECSEGAEFNVSPEDAIVSINGKEIGKADDWDGMGGGQTFKFPQPGTYYVQLSLKGYQTALVRIVVKKDAKEKIADVDTELVEEDEKPKEKKDKKG